MSINVFTASGNVGKDLEIRMTPAGKAIGQFSLPVKQGWGDNEKVSWVSCKMFGERAQKMEQYIKKGTKITVTGEFVLEQWESNGVKNSRPVIIVNSLDFGGSNQSQGQQQAPRQQQRPQQAPQGQSVPSVEFDDDCPFAPIGLQYPALLNCI